MIRATTMDRARLEAFADGELSPEEAAAVVMHLADHAQDQAYVDEVMAANTLLGQAFGAPIHEPVPPAIMAAIMGAEVVPFRRRLFPVMRPVLGGLALAAAVTGLALFLLPQAGPAPFAAGPLAGTDALYPHLQGLPSGQTVTLADGRALTILASLPTAEGHCREAEVIDRPAASLTMLLACKAGQGWQIEVALSERLPQGTPEDGYVPAGGAETMALDLWLDRLGAGASLPPEEEARMIGNGWQP